MHEPVEIVVPKDWDGKEYAGPADRMGYDMIRVHFPSNGNIQDIQVWIADKAVDLSKIASFNKAAGDVYFPVKKRYEKVDSQKFQHLLESMAHDAGLVREIAFEESRRARQLLETQQTAIEKQRREKISMHRTTRWLTLAWMLVLAVAIVVGVHYFDIIESWVRSLITTT